MSELAGYLSTKNEQGRFERHLCILKDKKFLVYPIFDGKFPLCSIDIGPNVIISKNIEYNLGIDITSDGNTKTYYATNQCTYNLWYTVLSSCSIVHFPITISDFSIIATIGQGFFGKVRLVQKKDTQEYYALKSIQKHKLHEMQKLHTIMYERNSLCQVNSEFVVQLYYAFQSDRKVYFCLEYVPGGTLFSHMKEVGTLPIGQMKLYIAEIAIALNAIHKANFVYRDLKPENVLLDGEGHIKLTDFGYAKYIGDSQTASFSGTCEYIAPEIASGESYGFEVDWWSLGILIYEMAFRTTPFAAQNQKRILDRIVSRDPSYPGLLDVNLVDLIEGLLEKDPKYRLGFKEVSEHPFLADFDFGKVERREYTPEFIPATDEAIRQHAKEYGDEEIPISESLGETVPIEYQKIRGFSYDGGI